MLLQVIPGESQDGSYSVVVTVSDGLLTDSQDIELVVNDVNLSSIMEGILSDQDLEAGFKSLEVDLAGLFSDPDGDDLSLEGASDSEGVVTASVTGTTLTLVEVGEALITVSATRW